MRFRWILAFVSGVASLAWTAASQSAPNAGQVASKPSLYELEENAFKAYNDKKYGESIKLYEQAFSLGLNRMDDAYNAACSAALSGDHPRAVQYLQRAVRLGFRDPEHLKLDSDLESLRSDATFRTMIAKAEDNERRYERRHSDPEHAAIVVSDIDRFWIAYDHLKRARDREAVLEREYLERGSPGLQDFVFERISSAAQLLKTMDQAPEYYAALRPASMRIKEMIPGMRASFRKLKQLYPSANFPDVYFLIGRMNSGGTTGSSGLLLGADMFGKQPGVSLAELSEWHRSVLMSVDDIPHVVAHELIHFEQKNEGKTLLAQAMEEGSADFLGEMVSGGKTNDVAYDYGTKHEAELWNEFSKEMNGDNLKHWLYQGKTIDGRPADLGYFIGYRISQAYYEKASDKQKAIAEILNFKDASLLLKESGYEERFTSLH